MTIDWTIGLGALLAVAASVLASWVTFRVRMALAEKRAHEAFEIAKATREALADFKLYVANNYAQNGHLEKVESRLLAKFDELVDEMKGLRKDFMNMIGGFRLPPK